MILVSFDGKQRKYVKNTALKHSFNQSAYEEQKTLSVIVIANATLSLPLSINYTN